MPAITKTYDDTICAQNQVPYTLADTTMPL
jgi:hypothetical protein